MYCFAYIFEIAGFFEKIVNDKQVIEFDSISFDYDLRFIYQRIGRFNVKTIVIGYFIEVLVYEIYSCFKYGIVILYVFGNWKAFFIRSSQNYFIIVFFRKDKAFDAIPEFVKRIGIRKKLFLDYVKEDNVFRIFFFACESDFLIIVILVCI